MGCSRIYSAALAAMTLAFAVSVVAAAEFQRIDNGLELVYLDIAGGPSGADTSAVILRVDPAIWEFRLVSTSQTGEGSGLTARQWSEKYGLTAAINAGMFQEDLITHVGYMKSGSHINSRLRNKYLSAVAFSARRAGIPAFRLVDLDVESLDTLVVAYDCAVQNLRLIKHPGENVWTENPRKWSEAALAEDSSGRALFVFCKQPVSMSDFNRWLLSLGFGIVRAQHLEGGSEAQLYVRAGHVELELAGGYDTGIINGGHGGSPAQIPFVIGISRRNR